MKFEGATGLGQLLRENPRVPACLVRNLYATGVGRPVRSDERPLLAQFTKAFAEGGYKVPAFMKTLALSDTLHTATLAPAQLRPKPAEKVTVASLTSAQTKEAR